MKSRFAELRQFSNSLNRRHAVLGAGLFLIDWTCAWAMLALWDKWISPLQELTSLILLLVLCGLYALSLYPVLRWHKKNVRVDVSGVASRIENAFPELNDLLRTATFLDGKNLHNLNPLEAHVMDSADHRLREIAWKTKVTHLLERRSVVFGTLITGAILAVFSFKTIPLQKAIYHIQDNFGQSPTGLIVTEPPLEVPAPSDLNVEFIIHRWQNQAWIDWSDSTSRNREPVVVNTDGTGVFTFYGMTDPLQFRIETPSLRSVWFEVEVYSPARIEALEITVSPPAYTRLQDKEFTGIQDFKAVEGSNVVMRLRTQSAERADLLTGESSEQIESIGDQSFSVSLKPPQTTAYGFQLTDIKGRESQTASKTLTIIPDEPPIVEILHPARDSVLAPGEIFPVELFATDDFGLTKGRIHLTLSGADQPSIEIPLSQFLEYDEAGNELPLTETSLMSKVDLGTLDADDGDLLAIHIEVEDNREPTSNLAQSDLLFMEIRAPVEPVEMEGMPADQKKINFRELIEEQKRLLRETHRLNAMSPDSRNSMMQEIPASLSTLAVEIGKIQNEVSEALVSSGRADLGALFVRALTENSNAIQSFENEAPDESISPQSSSLSALLKLENAFRQNTKSKEPAKGDSGEGESGESEEQQEKGPSEGKTITEALKDAKAQLDQLIQNQNALISEFDRAAQSSWSEKQADSKAKEQNQLREETGDLQQQLNALPDSEMARQSLATAGGHMKSAAANASQSDAGGALRSGLRARESLRFASSELAGMLAEAAAQELEAAARAASQLAQEQAAAAGASEAAESGNPSEQELAAMEENQRNMRERFDGLIETMQQRSRQSAGANPQMSESLQQAAQNAGQRGTSEKMERSANALLYGQAGMAAPMQSAAAGEISKLASELQEARERIKNDPTRRAQAINRELQATLEELASHARNPETAPKARLPEIQKEWSNRFMELQQLSGIPQFGNLSGKIAGDATGDWDGQLGSTRSALQQGARILHEFLFNEASQSDLQMNREAAPPPDQYRKMVEEYFRRLAREPEER